MPLRVEMPRPAMIRASEIVSRCATSRRWAGNARRFPETLAALAGIDTLALRRNLRATVVLRRAEMDRRIASRKAAKNIPDRVAACGDLPPDRRGATAEASTVSARTANLSTGPDAPPIEPLLV